MAFTPAPTNGDDILTDTPGDDTVDALAGNDQITVTGGFDTVNGGADRDRLIIDYSNAFQRLFMDGPLTGSLAAGYSGRLTVGFNNFRVDFGGIEDFTITGSAFNDALTVGDGDDIVNAGGGDDFVTFGAGNDSGDGGTGTDGFSADLGSATSAIGINLVTNVSGSFTNFEYIGTLTTGSGNDTIVTRADLVIGETINTGAGADTITVARGYDGVAGGADRDRLIIDYSAATQGVRTENNALSGALAGGYSGIIWQGVNNFRVDFSGIEDFTVTTGESNDSITTGDGDDVINLGGGDDFANFGAGNDSGDGGTGTDGFSANLGSDTLGISINLVTGASSSFSNFEYLGALTTGIGNDTIVTRADVTAFETISTGAGMDTITVARGFDNVAGGADRDRLIVNYTGATQGVSTDGTFSGSLGAGYTGRIGQGNTNYIVDFSGIEDFTVTTGDTNDNITTFDGDDIITLGGGDDFANFGAGNDSGDGGDGTDGFSANLSSATTGISINLVTGVSATFNNFEFLGTLTTGSGNDTVVTRGIIREEFINTGIGDDTITVAGGFDRANGGADRDRLVIDYTGATQSVSTDGVFSGSLAAGYTGRIWQGNGNYTVDFSGIEDFTVTTGGTNDNIRVFDGDDVVNVGGGDDFVDFGAGNDSGDGGSGTDGFSANLGSATAGVSINLVTGVSATFSNFEYLGTLITGSGNDTIVTRADVLAGEAINAGAGADTITVARGFDNVAGGSDRDRLIIDYTGATQNVNTDGTFSGSLAAGYTGRIGQGNTNYIVDFSGIEDFTVTTGGTDDTIRVFDGDDVVNLGGGNDFANFGAGNDSGDGGTGTDGFSADLSSDTLGVSINLVTGVSATFSNFEYLGTLTTGSGNDTIVTRADVTANEAINAGAGTDTITVARGFDTVAGGTDRDRLIIDYTGATQNVFTENGVLSGTLAGGYTGRIGQGNTNYIVDFSGIEDFTITTGGTDDSIITGDGDDVIRVGAGNDGVNSGAGNDLVEGGDGNDTLNSGADTDTLSYASASAGVTMNLSTTTQQNTVGAGLDTISGFENLIGSALADTLTGTSGANVIDGGTGADSMTGLAGDDLYLVDNIGDTVTEASGEGTDEIRTALASYSMAAFANVETLTGTSGAGQALTGNAGANLITGLGGNDTLDGGAGIDTLVGNAGDDTYIVDDASDVVTEASGEGTDEVRSSAISYALAANVENLTGTSGAGQTLIGNGAANVITGLGGNDTLDGGAGIDTLIGGAGNDTYSVDEAGDVVTEASGQGTDEIRTGLATYSLAALANVENLTGTSGAGQALTGNGGVNVITGLGGNDTLDGGAGADTLVGGAGDDIYVVDDAGDVVTEGAGEGVDEIRTTVANYQLAANVEKLTYVGAGATTVGGNAANNTIAGAGGNDVLNLSQGGNDTVSGGGGNDAIFFGATFGAGDQVDGGAGANDQLGLQGDYTGANALTLSGATLTGVETVALLAGFDYSVTALDDLLTTAGQKMTIFGSGLGAGDNLTFDGSAESNRSFLVYGGLGTDLLTGGGGNDGFQFAAGRFDTATDVINGGNGNDQVALNAFSGTLSGANLISVETVVLLSGSNSIVIADDWTLGGQSRTVFGTGLTQGATINGSAETDGNLALYGGLGNDVITGGAGNDMIIGGGRGDTLTGGAGNDTFVYRNLSDSDSTERDGIQDFTLGDLIDLSLIDANSNVAGNQDFLFVGTNAFSGTAGELRYENISGGGPIFLVQSDVNGDGVSDMEIVLVNTDGHTLGAADFLGVAPPLV